MLAWVVRSKVLEWIAAYYAPLPWATDFYLVGFRDFYVLALAQRCLGEGR